jgi:hypothetical protein
MLFTMLHVTSSTSGTVHVVLRQLNCALCFASNADCALFACAVCAQYCHKDADDTNASACSNKPFTGKSVTGGYIYRGLRLVHILTASVHPAVQSMRGCIDKHMCVYTRSLTYPAHCCCRCAVYVCSTVIAHK